MNIKYYLKYIILSICLVLIVLISSTYSRFSYSKELSGSIVTISQLPKLYNILLESYDSGNDYIDIYGNDDDTYPIIYFFDQAQNNSVILGDYCWLIVRTTETGGIKLVFNGPVVNANGTKTCSDYSGVSGNVNENFEDIFPLVGGFSGGLYNSPVYVGYMYNDINNYINASTNTIEISAYRSHLADNNIDSETGRHVQNLKDSNAKTLIDTWYEENILGKPEENLLEDTVWCNNRTIASVNSANNMIVYDGENSYLTCPRYVDSFTVDRQNGNGDLTYPIGMLTASEISMAGQYGETFLDIVFGTTWDGTETEEFNVTLATMTPFAFELSAYLGYRTDIYVVKYYCELLDEMSSVGNNAVVMPMQAVGGNCYVELTGESSAFTNINIRPAISLKNSTKVVNGDGSFGNPYIIG